MEFVEKLYNSEYPNFYRKACRGIVRNKNNELLMIYCEYFNDYSFAGGGLEKGEDDILCLTRELEEELGIKVKNIKPFCVVTEKRMSTFEYKHNFIQENHYYICDIDEEVEQKLEKYEIEYGFQKAYITIDDAIVHNSKVLQMVEKYKTKYIEKINGDILPCHLPDIKRFGSEASLRKDLYILNLLKEQNNERF